MRRIPVVPFFLSLTIILMLTTAVKPVAAGQDLTSPSVVSRVTVPIDDTKLEPIKGQVHPLARREFDQGVVDDNMPVERLIVLLKRTPEQERDAALLIDQLHNRNSPMFHHWLGAEEYGKRFGPTDDDLAKLTGWLQSKGFTIDDVPAGRTHITISGNAGMIRDAFHAEIHHLLVNGERQKSILSDPQVPAALAPLIAGFVQLHSWHAKPLYHGVRVVRKHKDSGGWEEAEGQSPGPAVTVNNGSSPLHAVTPQDWNTIYNANPLSQSGINGAGTTIAVLEQTKVNSAADVNSFRAQFGLSAYPATPNSTAGGVNWMYGPGDGCTAPGVSSEDEGEGLIDVEWAGAVAPKAIVDYVACASSGSGVGSGGIDQAAAYVANVLHASVVAASLSYYGCELNGGSNEGAYFSGIFHQMAFAGITAVVSSGDSGSTGCDVRVPPTYAPVLYAQNNVASNALSSSPFAISAGGTDFSEMYQGATSQYWNNTDAVPYGSALSYIPEMSWGGLCSSPVVASYYQNTHNTAYGTVYTPEAICNNSNANPGGLLRVIGGSGGVDTNIVKIPTWQSVYGIGLSGNNTSTAWRNQPDISLFAAYSPNPWGHALLYCQSDVDPCAYNTAGDAIALAAGGTSFVAPQIAGIMALINQYVQSRQGVANYTLYSLAANQYGVPNSPNAENLANCSGSMLGPMVGSNCIFLDINTTPNPSGGTVSSNIVEPCLYSSSNETNCFRATATDLYGLSSLGTHPTTNNPAYQVSPGYDLATGLGSVNVYNLVANWNLTLSFPSTTALAAPNPASIASTASTILSATVTATGRGSISPPVGTVAFYLTSAGGSVALLGSSSLSQSCTGASTDIVCAAPTASLTVPGTSLNPGANSIVAEFSGDGANDAPSTSTAVTVTVSATSQNVTTLSPSAVTSSGATLNGTVNPEGSSGNVRFQYGTSSTFASYYTTNELPVTANASVQPFAYPVTGLTSGTKYYCRIDFNDGVDNYGATRSFATLPAVVTTLLPISLSSGGATLSGTINPQGSPGNAWFQYGTSPTFASYYTTNQMPVTANMSAQPFAYPVTGLTASTKYYFRIVFNDGNTNNGATVSFTTLPAVVTTLAATSVTSNGATLNGTINPGGSPGNAWFQYGTSATFASYYTTNQVPVTANMSAQAFPYPVSGLTAGTKYYFRMVFNDGITYNGATVSFTTLPPVMTTLAATALTPGSATLNGTINPQGSPGNAWFQYGTSSTFASYYTTNQVPVTANTSTQAFPSPVSGLSAGTKYYFRIAYNNGNTYYGGTLSFTPPLPVETTQAATAVTLNSATLNGTVNPQGSPGNAYFQYGTSSTFASYYTTSEVPVTANTAAQSFAYPVSGLTSGTTYYFRMVFNNGNSYYGTPLSLKTSAP
jgi:subtilase family serine protease